jgi:hypothetical membrane protein
LKPGANAFPNAYVSTDEPPRRSRIRGVLCAVAAAGVAYFGLTMLALSLASTEYNPVSQYASDYGVGAYALEMNLGFFVAGIGFLCLALAGITSSTGRAEKVGSYALLPSGLALLVDAFYHTDIEGAAGTLHGLVHNIGGVVFFSTATFGLLLMSGRLGRRGRALTVLAFLAAYAFLILNGALSLGATGLGERIVILVVFSSAIANSVRIYRLP